MAVIQDNTRFVNDVIVTGKMDIQFDLICNGLIMFKDLSDLDEENRYRYVEMGVSMERLDPSIVTFCDLLVDGNIVLDSNRFNEYDIYEKIKMMSYVDINPKVFTVKCKNFYIQNDFLLKNNCIFVSDGRMVSMMRQLKLNKILKNE
jgi:hypothetical protein